MFSARGLDDDDDEKLPSCLATSLHFQVSIWLCFSTSNLVRLLPLHPAWLQLTCYGSVNSLSCLLGLVLPRTRMVLCPTHPSGHPVRGARRENDDGDMATLQLYHTHSATSRRAYSVHFYRLHVAGINILARLSSDPGYASLQS